MTTGHFLSENSFILVVVFIKIEHIFIIFKYYSKAQRIKKKFSELSPPLKKKKTVDILVYIFLRPSFIMEFLYFKAHKNYLQGY